jgi:thioredoxin reductase (NADPH)
LQSITAEPPKARVTVVGPRWDAVCGDLRRFLDRNQVSFEWLALDAPHLPAAWPGPPPIAQDCPILRLADGTVVSRPNTREVARLLGLQTSARAAEYDTVVIGAGPAGLAAAVYGASEGLRTIVVEREAPGGQAGTSSRIENYLGFPNGVFRRRTRKPRIAAGAAAWRGDTGNAFGSQYRSSTREVLLDGDEVISARTVILATGVAWRRLAIEGFERLIGKGIYYGAARSEAGATNGMDLYLIGAGNSAGQAAIYFANHARRVTLVVRGESLKEACRNTSSISCVRNLILPSS